MSIKVLLAIAAGDVAVLDQAGHAIDYRPDTSIHFLGEGRTKQSFKDGADINNIMARFLKSGSLDYVSKHEPSYGDVSPQTFHEAMDIVAKAAEMFADLPSTLRKRFNQSASEFLAFVQDSKNIDEMRRLGIAKPLPPPPETPVARRTAELEVDREARLELARRAVVAPPAP